MAAVLISDDGEFQTFRRDDGSRFMLVTPGSPTANRGELDARAAGALAVNATYLAVASPTNAQNLAQIRALTRECNALIRLLLGRLDDTTGT